MTLQEITEWIKNAKYYDKIKGMRIGLDWGITLEFISWMVNIMRLTSTMIVHVRSKGRRGIYEGNIQVLAC